MRFTILILSLAIGIGIGLALPIFVEERIAGMGITIGTSSHEISETIILWALRGLGICIGLAGILYVLAPKHDPDA